MNFPILRYLSERYKSQIKSSLFKENGFFAVYCGNFAKVNCFLYYLRKLLTCRHVDLGLASTNE